MLNYLKTAFDKWSLVHAMTGFIIGMSTSWLIAPIPWLIILIAGVLSVGWEILEIHIEKWRGDEPEHWINRWITDHVCVVGGAVLGWLFYLV